MDNNYKENNKIVGDDIKINMNSNHNNIDLLHRYIHDIRNIKPLDKEMINKINGMTNNEKLEIILAFNDVVQSLKGLLEQ